MTNYVQYPIVAFSNVKPSRNELAINELQCNQGCTICSFQLTVLHLCRSALVCTHYGVRYMLWMGRPSTSALSLVFSASSPSQHPRQ